MTPRVVLVGLPGTGKSTTGRRLAKILALPFTDSDDLVEAATGRTVRELFVEAGEAGFREQEASAVQDALREFEGVLALGGGALTHAPTHTAVAGCGAVVVLLEASVPTLVERVGEADSRPLLTGAPEDRLRELSAQRTAAYRSVAALTVQTDGKTPSQVAARIAARLHDLDRARAAAGRPEAAP